MQTPDLRYFFPLSRPQVGYLLALLLCLYAETAQAQGSRSVNMENYDRRKIHYGFQAGMFSTISQLTYSEAFANERDTVNYIDGLNTSGFSLGLIINFALKDELWDFRFAPNFAFYQHEVAFNFWEDDAPEPTTDVNIIEATMLELPLLFMYKSQRRMNSRMYMFGGLTPSIQLGGRIDESTQRTIIFNRTNLEVSYGLGFHFYMKMFNLAPELRISHGLINRLNQTDNPFSSNLKRVTSHKISLFLNFEG